MEIFFRSTSHTYRTSPPRQPVEISKPLSNRCAYSTEAAPMNMNHCARNSSFGYSAEVFSISTSRQPKPELGYPFLLPESTSKPRKCLHKHCRRRVCFIGYQSYLTFVGAISRASPHSRCGSTVSVFLSIRKNLKSCGTPISALGDAMEARTPIDGVKGRFPILLEDGTIFYWRP